MIFYKNSIMIAIIPYSHSSVVWLRHLNHLLYYVFYITAFVFRESAKSTLRKGECENAIYLYVDNV